MSGVPGWNGSRFVRERFKGVQGIEWTAEIAEKILGVQRNYKHMRRLI